MTVNTDDTDENDASKGPEDGIGEEMSQETSDGTESLLGEVGREGQRRESTDGGQEVVEDIGQIVAEFEELLETVDLSEVPEAIDIEDLPEALDVSDVPEAIKEGDAGEALSFRALPKLLEFDEVREAVDLREFRRQLRELEAAVEEAGFTDSEDGENDSSILEEPLDGDSSGGLDGSHMSGVEDVAAEAAAGNEVRDAAEEFRSSLQEAHDRLADLVSQNEERAERIEQPSSRNPTAFSTLATTRETRCRVGRHSTVPSETRHSSSPNPDRVYGDRFDEEANDE